MFKRAALISTNCLILIAFLLCTTTSVWAFGGGGSGRGSSYYKRKTQGTDSIGLHVDPGNPIKPPIWRDCNPDTETLVDVNCCPNAHVAINGDKATCCEAGYMPKGPTGAQICCHPDEVVKNGQCVQPSCSPCEIREGDQCVPKECGSCQECDESTGNCVANQLLNDQDCSQNGQTGICWNGGCYQNPCADFAPTGCEKDCTVANGTKVISYYEKADHHACTTTAGKAGICNDVGLCEELPPDDPCTNVTCTNPCEMCAAGTCVAKPNNTYVCTVNNEPGVCTDGACVKIDTYSCPENYTLSTQPDTTKYTSLSCTDKDGTKYVVTGCTTGYEWNEQNTECVVKPEYTCDNTYTIAESDLDTTKYTYIACTDKNGTNYKVNGCAAGYEWNGENTECIHIVVEDKCANITCDQCKTCDAETGLCENVPDDTYLCTQNEEKGICTNGTCVVGSIGQSCDLDCGQCGTCYDNACWTGGDKTDADCTVNEQAGKCDANGVCHVITACSGSPTNQCYKCNEATGQWVADPAAEGQACSQWDTNHVPGLCKADGTCGYDNCANTCTEGQVCLQRPAPYDSTYGCVVPCSNTGCGKGKYCAETYNNDYQAICRPIPTMTFDKDLAIHIGQDYIYHTLTGVKNLCSALGLELYTSDRFYDDAGNHLTSVDDFLNYRARKHSGTVHIYDANGNGIFYNSHHANIPTAFYDDEHIALLTLSNTGENTGVYLSLRDDELNNSSGIYFHYGAACSDPNPCAAGKYRDLSARKDDGTYACVPCADGKYSESGWFECIACPAGKKANATKTGCEPAEAGTECGDGKVADGFGNCVGCTGTPPNKCYKCNESTGQWVGDVAAEGRACSLEGHPGTCIGDTAGTCDTSECGNACANDQICLYDGTSGYCYDKCASCPTGQQCVYCGNGNHYTMCTNVAPIVERDLMIFSAGQCNPTYYTAQKICDSYGLEIYKSTHWYDNLGRRLQTVEDYERIYYSTLTFTDENHISLPYNTVSTYISTDFGNDNLSTMFSFDQNGASITQWEWSRFKANNPGYAFNWTGCSLPEDKECPTGKRYNINTKACEECPAGTYTRPWWFTCETCPAGQQPNADQSGCEPCEASTTAGTCGCPTGKYPDGFGNCVGCSTRPADTCYTCNESTGVWEANTTVPGIAGRACTKNGGFTGVCSSQATCVCPENTTACGTLCCGSNETCYKYSSSYYCSIGCDESCEGPCSYNDRCVTRIRIDSRINGDAPNMAHLSYLIGSSEVSAPYSEFAKGCAQYNLELFNVCYKKAANGSITKLETYQDFKDYIESSSSSAYCYTVDGQKIKALFGQGSHASVIYPHDNTEGKHVALSSDGKIFLAQNQRSYVHAACSDPNPCPAGKYRDLDNQGSNGEYSCKSCTDPRQYSETGWFTCLTCDKGYEANSDHSACIPSPIGSPNSGCATGKYPDGNGNCIGCADAKPDACHTCNETSGEWEHNGTVTEGFDCVTLNGSGSAGTCNANGYCVNFCTDDQGNLKTNDGCITACNPDTQTFFNASNETQCTIYYSTISSGAHIKSKSTCNNGRCMACRDNTDCLDNEYCDKNMFYSDGTCTPLDNTEVTYLMDTPEFGAIYDMNKTLLKGSVPYYCWARGMYPLEIEQGSPTSHMTIIDTIHNPFSYLLHNVPGTGGYLCYTYWVNTNGVISSSASSNEVEVLCSTKPTSCTFSHYQK